MINKELVAQIIVATAIVCVVFCIGIVVLYIVIEVSVTDQTTVCDNLTPENYNITPNHESCKFNETTGKYDLNWVLSTTHE